MSLFADLHPLAPDIASGMAAICAIECAVLVTIKMRWPKGTDRCLRAGLCLSTGATLGVALCQTIPTRNSELFWPWLLALALLMARLWLMRLQFGACEELRASVAGTLDPPLSQAQQRSTAVLGELGSGDAWVGLPQRQALERQLAERVSRNAQHATLVLSLGIEGLREVYHAYERHVADKLMHEVLMRLKRAAGSGADISRLGMDEFVVITSGQSPLSEDGIKARASSIQETLQHPYLLPSAETVLLTCCIGTSMTSDAADAHSLIDCADAAKQIAKTQGASGIAVFDPAMARQQRFQLALRHDLKRAIAAGELSLHYQPKVACGSNAMVGVEALVRWNHRCRGSISPSEFIPVAERCGLIADLGDWVVLEACQQIRRWKSQGILMGVAINLSAKQLQQADLATRILSTVSACGVEPQQLIFEITETAAMDDPEQAMQIIAALASSGATVALDDFGNGYSSLSTLRKLPVHQIKLDRSFVVDLETSHQARAMVNSVIRLAHALGQQVVAEGVETPRQVQILQTMGCDELQGFYFALPMSADALYQWLRHDRPDPRNRNLSQAVSANLSAPISA